MGSGRLRDAEPDEGFAEEFGPRDSVPKMELWPPFQGTHPPPFPWHPTPSTRPSTHPEYDVRGTDHIPVSNDSYDTGNLFPCRGCLEGTCVPFPKP